MSSPASSDRRASRGRVGVVVSGRQIGSRERLFLAVAQGLANRGWQVDLLAAGPEVALREAVSSPLGLADFSPRGLQALRAPHLLRISLGVPGLARWIARHDPALLFGTSIPPNLASLVAARRARRAVPVVIRQSNTLRIAGHPRYGGLRRRWRDPWIPRLYREAAHVIAVAGEVADNLSALGAADPARVTVVPNAVELDDALTRAAAAPTHPWFGQSDVPLLVSVGRLVRKKDHLTLLEAFARLHRRQPARLVVFGEGPMRATLEARVAQLGLAEAVSFPGHTDNPFAHVARADLFVLSSVSEGMPSALIEALACGTPAVSTDCPSGPREVLGDGRFGELVPVGDADALAGAMSRVLDVPRSPTVLQGRAQEFGLERAVEGYVDLLEEVARSGPPSTAG